MDTTWPHLSYDYSSEDVREILPVFLAEHRCDARVQQDQSYWDFHGLDVDDNSVANI